MHAHPDRAFCRQQGPCGLYAWRALRRIAREFGPCQDRYTALWHIEQAAQDFQTAVAQPGEAKARLTKLAAALRAADQMALELDAGGTGRLAWAAHERGLKVCPEYLTDLAEVAEQAAADVERSRKNKERDEFIRRLAECVKRFSDWRPTVTNDRHYPKAPYGGKFVEVAIACLEPLGLQPRNQALGKEIQRVLSSMDKLSA